MTVKKKGKITVKDFRKLESEYKELSEKSEPAFAKAKEYEEKIAAGAFPHVQTGNRTGGDETKAMRDFGCGSNNVLKLLNVNTEAPEYRHVNKDTKALVRSLKNAFTTGRAIAQMFYGDSFDRVGATEKTDSFAKCAHILETNYGKDVLVPMLKAFGTDQAQGGAEWVPTGVSSTYIPELELDREIVGMLQPIDMPTSPYELNVAGSSIARRATENATSTEGTFVTGDLAFSAKKYQEYFLFSEEINEDSAVGIIALGQQNLTQAHLNAYEMSCINGTEIGTVHIDSDTEAGSALLAEKQFHGWRKLALDNSANGSTIDFGNAAVTDAKLREMRQAFGKFGVKPSDMVWVPGSTAYLQMLATDNVVTVDKLGQNATILTGMLGSYDGIPIVQTGYQRNTLNAAGVYDGITTDRSGMLLVHRLRWYWGTRRPIRMAIRPSKVADDRIEMAAYSRVDFKGHPQSDNLTEFTVAYGHNIPS